MFTIASSTLNQNHPVIDISLNVFIVPNSLMTVNDVFDAFRPSYEMVMKDVLAQKGEELDNEKDLLVQLWYTNGDTENLSDHGLNFEVVGDENGGVISIPNELSFLPVKLFDGLGEGDKVDVDVPAWIYQMGQHKKNATLRLHLTLDQSDYRYRRYGDFASLLNTLAINYEYEHQKEAAAI